MLKRRGCFVSGGYSLFVQRTSDWNIKAKHEVEANTTTVFFLILSNLVSKDKN